MMLDLVIIAVGILVFVMPGVGSRLRRAVRSIAEKRRRPDGERQRRAHERRWLATERDVLAAELVSSGREPAGCPWCGFPISPPR